MTFRQYVSEQIVALEKDDSQVSWDRIKDYKEIEQRGVYRTPSSVKALRDFKKGEVVYDPKILSMNDPYLRLLKDETRHPNVEPKGEQLVALKDIKEEEDLTINFLKHINGDLSI